MWGSGDGGDATYLQTIIEGLRGLNIMRPSDGRVDAQYSVKDQLPFSALFLRRNVPPQHSPGQERQGALGKCSCTPRPNLQSCIIQLPSGEASATMVRDEHGLV